MVFTAQASLLSVNTVKDGIVTLRTTSANLFAGELVFFQSGTGRDEGLYGLTMTLLADTAIVVVLGSDRDINEKTPVYATGESLVIQAGLHCFGKMLDSLAR